MASDVNHEPYRTTNREPCRTRLATLTLSSLFRVIPAREYLDYFASDRSHMVSRLFPASTLPTPPSPWGSTGYFTHLSDLAELCCIPSCRLAELLFPIACGRCG